MAAAKKSAPAKTAEVAEVVEEAEASSDEVVVDEAPQVVSFTPVNTWTLYYGADRYDFTEGVTVSVPEEVARYLKKHQAR